MRAQTELNLVKVMGAELRIKSTSSARVSTGGAMGIPAPVQDERRYPRRPYSGRVTCEELGHCELAALDISPKGVGLLSPRLFLPGQTVTLYFLDGTMKVQGTVSRVRAVYSTDWQVGVSFREDQHALLQAINAVS